MMRTCSVDTGTSRVRYVSRPLPREDFASEWHYQKHLWDLRNSGPYPVPHPKTDEGRVMGTQGYNTPTEITIKYNPAGLWNVFYSFKDSNGNYGANVPTLNAAVEALAERCEGRVICCPNDWARRDEDRKTETAGDTYESRIATLEASLSGVAELRKRVEALEGGGDGGRYLIADDVAVREAPVYACVDFRCETSGKWIEQCAVPKSLLPYLVSWWRNR